jgi:hypothetical protein
LHQGLNPGKTSEQMVVYLSRSMARFRPGLLGSSAGCYLQLLLHSASGRCCVPGALVRLPSAFTDNNHSMTATVTEDAKQRFLES